MARILPNKPFLVMLMFCLIFTVVFAESFIAGNLEHDHPGRDCPVCLAIEMAQNLLKSLVIAALAAAFFDTAAAGGAAITKSKFVCIFVLSPIVLKVKIIS